MARKIEVEIIGRAESYIRSLGESEAATKSFGSRLGGMATLAAGGVVAGLGIAAVAIEKFTKKAMEEQAVTARMDSAFKAAHVSIRQYAGQIDTAEAAGRKLGFTNTDTQNSLGSLIVATHNGAKALADLAVAHDVARFKGTSLEAGTKTLTMAMAGSQRAIKQLGIMVVPVTAQVDALKNAHVKATTEAGRLEFAHAKLADKMATAALVIEKTKDALHGQSQAFADTAAGAMDRYHASMDALQVSIGSLFIPAVTKAASAVASGIEWFQNSATAHKYLQQYAHALGQEWEVLKGIVVGLVDAIRSNWSTIGPLVRDVVNIVKDVLARMMDAFKLVIDLLHGNWAKAWQDAKQLVADTIKLMADIVKLGVDLIFTAARLLGEAIWKGIKAGASALAGVVMRLLGDAANAVKGFVGEMFSAAVAIGKAIVGGVINGLEGMASDAIHAVSGFFGSLKKAAMGAIHAASPSKDFAEVGQAMGEGTIEGWILGTATLPSTMSKTLQAAITAARTEITNARSSFQTAFSSLTSLADTAFQAIQGADVTPAGKKLALMQAADQKAQLLDAVKQGQDAFTAAQQELQTAFIGSGMTEADQAAAIAKAQADIVAAQNQLADAKRAVVEANLAKAAAAEQRNLDAQHAIRQLNFDRQIAQLGAHLTREGATAAESTKEITALLARYGVNFADVGRDAGIAYIQALKDAMTEAAGKAGALSGAVSSAAAGITVPASKARAMGGPVAAGNLYLVGERGPEFFAPGITGSVIPMGAGGGGSPTLVFNFPNYVGDKAELVDVVHRGLKRKFDLNGSLGFS